MLAVSDAYKELVNSNIRPKCEPIITVTGVDESGKNIELVWTADQIQYLSFKRMVDILGRELPYMELTWTEIYIGKLNAENYPEKYNNIIKYMAVDLTFKQDLTFHNAWKSLFSGELSWKNVLNSFSTWKNVKNGVTQEILKMPRTFLVAKPVIQGQTITWTARDLLYFLNGVQSKSFDDTTRLDNALRFLLLNERANFKNSGEILKSLQATQTQIAKDIMLFDYVNKNTFIDSTTKDALKNLATIQGYYWTFEGNKATVRKTSDIYKRVYNPNLYVFSNNVLYELPTLTCVPTVSEYSFKQYALEANEGEKYTLMPYDTISYNGVIFNRFIFKDLGKLATDTMNVGISRSAISKDSTVDVIPYSLNSTDLYVNVSKNGDVFSEDNQCNISGIDSGYTKLRTDNFKRYYAGIYNVDDENAVSENQYFIEISSLANLALEPEDDVYVETNLYNGDGRITKRAIITSIEIEYNGAIKQKTALHTR